MMKLSILVLLCVACAVAQKQNTTPVPILKQINRHNEDGSFSYGYEAADGSFKIETRAATGEVKGKYGYVDADGNVREISYGADQNGFVPQGTGIDVPPPTIHADSGNRYPSLKAGEIDDGQYREDPNIYNDPKYNSRPSSSNKAASTFRINAQQPAAKPYTPAQNFNYQTTAAPVYEQPQATPAPQSQFYQSRFQAPVTAAPQNFYQQPQAQPNYYQPQNYYQQPRNYNQQAPVNIFAGHPAQNFDIYSGSYTIAY